MYKFPKLSAKFLIQWTQCGPISMVTDIIWQIFILYCLDYYGQVNKDYMIIGIYKYIICIKYANYL